MNNLYVLYLNILILNIKQISVLYLTRFHITPINIFLVLDNRKRDQHHEHKRETEVFHVPFRIPSNLSLLKSYPSIENDLSDVLCEILLEEETQICRRNEDAGSIFINIPCKFECYECAQLYYVFYINTNQSSKIV